MPLIGTGASIREREAIRAELKLAAPNLESGRQIAARKGKKQALARGELATSRRGNLSPKISQRADGRIATLELADLRRFAVMITPAGRGSFRDQTREVLDLIRSILHTGGQSATVTLQTIFLRDANYRSECEEIFAQYYGSPVPVTNFVAQAPADGAALAVEAWAISGNGVRLKRHGSHLLSVSYDGMRWLYCGGIKSGQGNVYSQVMESFRKMREGLIQAGSGFEHIVRTWFYLGSITEPEGATSRYQELNRARTDFFQTLHFGRSLPVRNGIHSVYPASTGIGTRGIELVTSCVALETEREDISLVPLENPQQTSAYAYEARYSRQSPKFSRGMALVTGNYITTWISGTASIVNSESRYGGDITAQTEQTIDNIERLISPENFQQHGIRRAGATLNDLTKIRVYLKRVEDLTVCRSVCEKRFGSVPSIYLVADICRPELLVEIEGVAFSNRLV
jgi:enamine deaminase RidA (YjgF/YER057c/UK114 family)